MKLNHDRKQISWKTVKYLAQALSVGVIMFVVALSLFSHPSNQMPEQTEEEKTVQAQNKVENSGSAATLSMQGAKVITTEEAQAVKRERLEKTEEYSDMPRKTGEKDAGDREEPVDVAEQERTSDKAASGRNRVVQSPSVDKEGQSASNRVVKNPEPDKLVSKLFENYGEKPEILDDVITLFQYPVELGYGVDSNYDGKLLQKNTILSFTVDTSEEAVDEESEEASKEDEVSEEVAASGDAMEVTEESQETEATTEELDEREKFKQEIWSKILATEPVDVKITAEEKEDTVREEKTTEAVTAEATEEEIVATTEETKASGDASTEAMTEATTQALEESQDSENATTEEAIAEAKVVADDTFFIIKGKMRTDRAVFAGDIEIKPSGKDGFDKVRMGESGEFTDSVMITEDAMEQSVVLYFSDGERVTTGYSWKYSKDSKEPQFTLKEESYQVLESYVSKIYCTNALSLDMDMSEEDKKTTKVHYIYGDKLVYITDVKEDGKPSLQQEFFGRIMMSGEDAAGNVSKTLSEYFLVEQNAPAVSFSQDAFCTIPYSLWVQVADAGHIVSGIRDVVCTVNGEERQIVNAEILEKVVLDEGLEVPSNLLFPVTFEEEGTYVVQVTVTDHAGNVTTQERVLEVTKPELVSVYMPEKFTIHIDPQQLAGREQIFSDAIELKNVSEMDVEVVIESVSLKVNAETSKEGVVKDCELYLVAPDTGEKIKLAKGMNEDVYAYRLPKEAQGDIANLTFVGITTDGSEFMWKGSDISLEVKLSFNKWEEEN